MDATTADRYTADDRKARSWSMGSQGPVPAATGAIVVGAILGLALLRRGFRGL